MNQSLESIKPFKSIEELLEIKNAEGLFEPPEEDAVDENQEGEPLTSYIQEWKLMKKDQKLKHLIPENKRTIVVYNYTTKKLGQQLKQFLEAYFYPLTFEIINSDRLQLKTGKVVDLDAGIEFPIKVFK